MKRIYAVILIFIAALSVLGAGAYTVYHNHTTGGESPTIHFDKDEIEVSTKATDEELLQGVTANDAEDGDVTDSLMVERIASLDGKNTITVSYVAFDSQNHVTRASRSAHYTDYTSPRFTMSRPMVFMPTAVGDMMDGIGAADCIDGDISVKVRAAYDNTESALREPGEHKVELTVTNSVGDHVSLMVPILVTESSPRSDQLPLKSYLVYLSKGSEFNPTLYYSDELVKSLADAAAKRSYNEPDPMRVESNVNTATEGVYTVDYKIVRNEEVTAQTRLIVVVR